MRISGRNPGLCCSSSSPSSSTVLVLDGGRVFGLRSSAHRVRTASVLFNDPVDDWLLVLNLLSRDGDDRDRFLSTAAACPMISRRAGDAREGGCDGGQQAR